MLAIARAYEQRKKKLDKGSGMCLALVMGTQKSTKSETPTGLKSGEDKTESIKPLYQRSRNHRHLADEYLRCGDMATACMRVGYALSHKIADEAARSERILASASFQEALREALRALAIKTAYRVATEEHGSAALGAIDRLEKLTKSTRPTDNKSAPRKKPW